MARKKTRTKKGGNPSGPIPFDVQSSELTSQKVQEVAEASAIVIKSHQQDDPLHSSRNVDPIPEDSQVFSQQGAIEPPFPPRSLVTIYESSAYLSPNIAAYVTNIDAFGHRFEKTIDFEESESREIVKNAMILMAQNELEDKGETGIAPDPSEKEIDKRIEELRKRQRLEKFRLDSLFNFIHPTMSFTQIRKQTRQDLEITANAYWEIIRSLDGSIAQVDPAVGLTMRMMDLGDDWQDVPMKFKTTPITMDTKVTKQRFRRFIQSQGVHNNHSVVWFKEFGDKRVMSASSGKYFKDVEEMNKKEKGAREATEILHFKIYSPRTPYGVPRWVGVLISAMGSRHSEEVNFLYFENKSVPPLALLVSGGKLTGGAVNRIKDYIQNEIKGKRNFHKILVVEAEASGKAGLPGTTPPQQIRLELKPLTDAQQSDALFQSYDKNNGRKIGSAFRVPPILRGDVEDFTRATAEASKVFADEQVFEPERNDFDFMINRRFLLDMDILLYRIRSQAPITRDPAIMAVILERLMKANLLVPKEGRLVASDILNMDLGEIKEGWATQPMSLTLAGFVPGQVPGITAPETPGGNKVTPNSTGAADRGEDEDVESTEKAEGDLSTADLRALGGLKVPAQGITTAEQRRQRRELLALLRNLQRLGIIDNVDDLVKKAMQNRTSVSGIEIKDDGDVDPKDIIEIKVPRKEFESWFEPEDIDAITIHDAEGGGEGGE